jgi:AP-3 complex subunit delta-1
MYKPKQENGFSDPNAAAFDPVSEPSCPKSLYLMHPIFSSYELNPVASIAQASVPVPDGLDLDAWIVPSMQDVQEHDDGDATERKTKRSKKGKEKESTSRSKVKGAKKKQKEEGYQEELAPQEEETATEKAERERVGIHHKLFFTSSQTNVMQLKAERLERMRDDPYYIMDDRSPKPPAEDIDSIPVIRLDGPLPLPKGTYFPTHMSETYLQPLQRNLAFLG